ncbi:hypothetical protein VFPPC_11512 [Pochonia chlamydosporia 170]|uniref:Uncharacterized protein n=1 Tax=Pochonia chlamydosporia 170 TaxID=1380566 RepID=A0A179F0N7_METCM|nr:hypothetical protein VFPPC_11512 [Pochonia chlamydosporia 170]OAQ59014.1 hypothetical protein VFPPC_11512 [Pochonia chlamydosporia 170]
MMDVYCLAVQSKSSFGEFFRREQGVSFSKLTYNPANKWGRRELLGLAVLPQRVRHLPVLSPFVIPWDQQRSIEITNFLKGPDGDYHSRSEHCLVRDPTIGHSLGQTWAALARFTVHEASGRETDDSDVEIEPRQKRPRRDNVQENYVKSDTMQVGSSSPLADGSQETSSSVGYVDRDSHYAWPHTENETLRFFSCLTRHILDYAAPQEDPIVNPVVELCDYVFRMKALTPILKREVSATADRGGLVLKENFDRGFVQTKKYVMIAEGKSEFQCIENGQPFLSDDCLGQMTCQALAARLCDLSEGGEELRDGSVIIAHPTRQYVCFLQFDISEEYLNNFETNFGDDVNPKPYTFMPVYISQWMDMTEESARKSYVETMSGLIARAAQNKLAVDDDDIGSCRR